MPINRLFAFAYEWNQKDRRCPGGERGFASTQEMFSAFSAKVEPAEYVRRIDAVLNRHYALGRIRMLAVARNTATPAQCQALPES
jgi:hypothetical protein